MKLTTSFNPVALQDVAALAADKKAAGYRFVQVLAIRTVRGCDLVYAFMKDGLLENFRLSDITETDTVPSVTPWYWNAFVFENEAHDLFGVMFSDLALDFQGKFYAVSKPVPMAELSEAQLKEKAKAEAEAAVANGTSSDVGDKVKPEPAKDENADLEAKLAAMDPEKAAKVRAAMAAKAAKAKKEVQ